MVSSQKTMSNFVYTINFVDTPWNKVRYANDVTTKATDGWWECIHPPEVCYKLDIQHVVLHEVWGMTKKDKNKITTTFSRRGSPPPQPQ